MQVIGVVGLTVTDTELSYTGVPYGTPPMAGIDVSAITLVPLCQSSLVLTVWSVIVRSSSLTVRGTS